MMHMQTAGFAGHGVGGSGGKILFQAVFIQGFTGALFNSLILHIHAAQIWTALQTQAFLLTELGRVNNMIVKGRSVAVL